jgi:hypothetical protein
MPKTIGLTAASWTGDPNWVHLHDGEFQLPQLRAPTIDLSVVGNGRLPDVLDDPAPARTVPLTEGPSRDGAWALTAYLWHAPNTFSNPLYFEDVMLERHGQERFKCLTPMISGTRFFATIPMLPYLATVQHPCECNYTLGYYRAGTCAPVLCQRPPYQRNAAIVEAAAISGAIIAIP